MKILRTRTAVRIFSVFTGILFVNMSFFLTGVSFFYPEDKQLIENVSNLVLNEEERDSQTNASDASLKPFALLSHETLMCHSPHFPVAEKLHHDTEVFLLRDGHTEKFSPPPEVFYGVC